MLDWCRNHPENDPDSEILVAIGPEPDFPPRKITQHAPKFIKGGLRQIRKLKPDPKKTTKI